MKRNEVFAGAPILRGRWSAVLCTWWSGWLIGRAHPLLDAFEGRLTVTDWWAVVGTISMVAGVIFLDQYGRNCWFTWTPDDVTWDGLHRDDVKRTPWIPVSHRLSRLHLGA
jgi:hypothetical protein